MLYTLSPPEGKYLFLLRENEIIHREVVVEVREKTSSEWTDRVIGRAVINFHYPLPRRYILILAALFFPRLFQ